MAPTNVCSNCAPAFVHFPIPTSESTLCHRLNEGFATYISYKGVKSAEPYWDMEAAFLTGDLHEVLDLASFIFVLAVDRIKKVGL